jgi:outer membrane protein insertion porin family
VLGMNFGLPISETSRAGLGVRYQYTNFIAGDTSELAQQFVEENGNVFNDFILSASYTNDSRDTAIFPTKGGLRVLRADLPCRAAISSTTS